MAQGLYKFISSEVTTSQHLRAWAVCGVTLIGVALLPRLGHSAGAAADEPDPDLTAVVLFSADGVDASIAASFGRDLREVMAATRKATGDKVPPVADLAPKNDGMLIVEGQQRLITARKYLRRGLEFLAEGDRKRAFEEFHRGLHYYRTAYPYARSDELYRDLVFYLAQTADSQKDKREKGRRWCEHLGLNVEISGAFDYLSRVNEIYDECDWVIDDPELKTLTMATNPPGARVYVDGIYRGVTPLQLTDLRRGEHLFTFEREGFRRVSRVMVVGAKFAETRELELGLHLKPGVYQYLYGDLVPIVAHGGPPADTKVLRNAAYALEVGRLLLVLVDQVKGKKGAIRTLAYSAEDDTVQREKIAVQLDEAGMAGGIKELIRRHYGVKAGPSVPPDRGPFYFKLQEPPVEVPKDDY